MRTREALQVLIKGRLASPAGRSELVELATRLIVEEALEGEVRDALERDYYERGAAPGQGHRNGHRTQRLKTAKGGPNAIACLAMAPEGGFLNAPDTYMEKIAVGGGLPEGLIQLADEPAQNLSRLPRPRTSRSTTSWS
jgi:hypothetical protein